MRLIIALLILCVPVVSAQQLHTFKNGEVADAEKINENFQYLLQNASGGCSAIQQDNSVLIGCADGTSGVIAGVGTVLVYPEGQIGQTPIADFPNGAIVAEDANDTTLGQVYSTTSDGWYLTQVSVQPNIQFAINNAGGIGEPNSDIVYYLTTDCSGIAFDDGFSVQGVLHQIGEKFFIPDLTTFQESMLFKSRITTASYNSSESACISGEFVDRGSMLVEYTPAEEILNAAPPVRLEQLP